MAFPIASCIFLVSLVVFVTATIITKRNWKLSRNIAGSTLIACELGWSLFGIFQKGLTLYAGIIAACFVLSVGLIYLQVRKQR